MWRKVTLLVLTAAMAGLAGWWLRGEAAKDTCLDMGGQWLVPGYCNGATKFRFE